MYSKIVVFFMHIIDHFNHVLIGDCKINRGVLTILMPQFHQEDICNFINYTFAINW